MRLILLGAVWTNVVRVVFGSVLYGENADLEVSEGAGLEGFMGGTNEATINLEVT